MNRQPTIKQRKLAENLLANVRKTKPDPLGIVLANTGYNKISKQPTRVITSKGVQQALTELKSQLQEAIPNEMVSETLANMITGTDSTNTEKLNAIKERNNLLGAYPDKISKSIGLFGIAKD